MTVPRSDILEIERRTLDTHRTAIVVGAAIAGAGIVTAAIIHGQSSGSNAPTEPPPNFLRLPVVTLRF